MKHIGRKFSRFGKDNGWMYDQLSFDIKTVMFKDLITPMYGWWMRKKFS